MLQPVVPHVLIRPCRATDVPAVRWLHDRTPAWGQVASTPQRWPPALDDIPRNLHAFWVAIERTGKGEAVVGMVGVGAIDLPGAAPLPEFLKPEPGMVRLDLMRVAPERWRLGIGRKLTRQAIAWCWGQGYKALLLETTPQQEAAVALYRGEGFVEAGRSTLGLHELIWMRLDL